MKQDRISSSGHSEAFPEQQQINPLLRNLNFFAKFQNIAGMQTFIRIDELTFIVYQFMRKVENDEAVIHNFILKVRTYNNSWFPATPCQPAGQRDLLDEQLAPVR